MNKRQNEFDNISPGKEAETLKEMQLELYRLRSEKEHLLEERSFFHNATTTSISPSPSVTLGEVLATFFESRWLITKITLLVTFLGVLYLFAAQPIYRVDALLETGMRIDLLADISKGFKEDTVVTEEIEALKSRKLLGEVVDDQKLEIISHPLYFPLIGSSIAQINTKLKLWGSPFTLGLPGVELAKRYAWNNQRVVVESFKISPNYLGRIFTLVALRNKEYKLYDDEGKLLTEGRVGEVNTNWTLDGKQQEIFVSHIEGKAGNRFELSKIPRIDAINKLHELIIVIEKGVGSGVVQISLEGTNAEKITAIVNKLVDTFVQQERDKKSDKIGLSLEFMENQLPTLKKQVENAEAAINNFRQHHKTIDLSKETQVLLERMVAIETELSETKRKYTDLRYKFTPEHSQVLALDNQINALNIELDKINTKVNTFPETERQILSLTKDYELYSELYRFLRNRIGQLQLVKEAPVGYVGVLDRAEPSAEPVKPLKIAVMVVAIVLGIFLGIATAFFRKALKNAVKDPEIIEKQLGLQVYATIPHSTNQHILLKNNQDGKKAILAEAEPNDPAIEGLRSLRTSFHFIMLEAKNNVILITGPIPDIGKSFLTVNFGAVLASAGKRVLIIDADLRKGQLNKYFGLDGTNGLSDAIANGTSSIYQAIKHTHIEGLDIINAGTIPPNPAELLTHQRFLTAIGKLSTLYDYVIIDSPPIMLVTDAAIIGRIAGTTLLVVKAGEHTLREIENSVKRLEQGGVNLRGVIFNDMPISKSRYGYGSYGYAYEYTK